MTFTIRNGTSTCDRCKTRVGNTWRERALHVCPRVVATPTPAPTSRASLPHDPCEHCDGVVVRRADESTTNFRRRRFCGNPCARRAQAKARKERAA